VGPKTYNFCSYFRQNDIDRFFSRLVKYLITRPLTVGAVEKLFFFVGKFPFKTAKLWGKKIANLGKNIETKLTF